MADLFEAARAGNVDRMRELLLLETDGVQLLMQTDEAGKSVLHLAAENGHLAVVRYLQS